MYFPMHELGKPTSFRRLTIIVPVLRHVAAAEECLVALLAATSEEDQIILVIDGAEPSTSEEVDISDRIERLPLDRRMGPAGARNAGSRIASNELLLFLDSDIVVTREAIDGIRNSMEDPSLAAVFGSYDDAPAHSGFFSQYRNLLHHFTHQQNGGDASTFWAGFGMVRKTVFVEIGGFLESYERPCVEDIEMGLRVSSTGKRIQLRPDIQVKHLKRWTAGNMVKTDVMDRAIPWSRLIMERKELSDGLNTCWAARSSALCVLGVLGFAIGGLLFPTWLLASSALLLLFVWINRRFYRFLTSIHGLGFAALSIPWHGFYYLYSAATFSCVAGAHHIAQCFKRSKATPDALTHS